jgi:hypothetical protein
LLAAFDAAIVPAARRGRSTSWRAAVAVLAVLSCVLALGVTLVPSRLSGDRRTATALSAKPPETVAIRAEGDARWSRWTEPHVERIVLESGSLAIRVEKARTARRVVVVLPDGELEDIGTTFSVSAAGARTTRVTVEEGSVILRLRGARPVVLGAGETWPSSSPPSALSAPSTAASSEPFAPNIPPSPPRVRAPRAAATPGSALSPVAPASDAAADFRAASSALNAGDHSGAARLLTAFLSNHPRDARIEDAAYLLVLAYHRSSDKSATGRAASDYLRRFPHGFRRTEVEALDASLP